MLPLKLATWRSPAIPSVVPVGRVEGGLKGGDEGVERKWRLPQHTSLPKCEMSSPETGQELEGVEGKRGRLTGGRGAVSLNRYALRAERYGRDRMVNHA